MENLELIVRESMEDSELIRGKSKKQIYMEDLYERIGFNFKAFDLPATASREEFDRKYQISSTKYLAGELEIDQWMDIYISYDRLCDYYKEKEEEERQEKERQKREMQWETEKLQRQLEARRKEEQRKGPLWVVLESLQKQEFQMSIEEFWESIKSQILNVLELRYLESYQEFLQEFMDLWTHLYQQICGDEYEEWKNKNLSSPCNRSIGMDELTLEKYELGKYRKLFEIAKLFSQMIPDSDDYYFLNVHFQLIANFRELEYKMEYFGSCPIFSFLTTSRLQKAKEQFLTRFDQEVMNGIRESRLVDSQELFNDVRERLMPYNSFFELPGKKPKMI